MKDVITNMNGFECRNKVCDVTRGAYDSDGDAAFSVEPWGGHSPPLILINTQEEPRRDNKHQGNSSAAWHIPPSTAKPYKYDDYWCVHLLFPYLL